MSNKPRLPRAVAESGALAESVAQQLSGTAPPADPAPVPPADPAPAPVTADDPAPAPAATTAPGELPTPEEWARMQQRHRTLQGSFNALTERHRESIGQVQQLQEKLSTTPAPTVDQPAIDRTIAAIKDQLGEELSQQLDQRIHHILDQRLASSLGPMRDVLATTLESDAERMRDAFLDRVEIIVPDFERLNTDPGFIAWLQQSDPASGHTLHELLQDAWAKLDASRAARFFVTYQREFDKTRTPAPVPRPETHGAPAPRPTAPKVIRRADIGKFYADQQRGVYRGREAEADAIERDIMNAQREGRIVD